MNAHHTILSIPAADARRLKIMFLAKHACSDGRPHPEDGNHAIYHYEMIEVLRGIFAHVTPRDSFAALNDGDGETDYLFTLLNRAGFPMSEMLGPLMAQRIGLPYLGASPIVRGLSDDKHLMKTVAAARGVPVSPWLIARRGALEIPAPQFAFDRLVVKPNASSASWGVSMPTDWETAKSDIAKLHGEGHDVIVERYDGEYDVVVPVVGGDEPILLPTVRFEMPGEDDNFRSYAEKRALTQSPKEVLVPVKGKWLSKSLRHQVRAMLPELWPFDYGRFEFRLDPKTGDIRFMEVNLSCNLWSKKTMSGAAGLIDIDHPTLVEHIVAYSLERQGLIRAARRKHVFEDWPRDDEEVELPIA